MIKFNPSANTNKTKNTNFTAKINASEAAKESLDFWGRMLKRETQIIDSRYINDIEEIDKNPNKYQKFVTQYGIRIRSDKKATDKAHLELVAINDVDGLDETSISYFHGTKKEIWEKLKNKDALMQELKEFVSEVNKDALSAA